MDLPRSATLDAAPFLNWGDFKEITKARLAVSVVFSALAGYGLAVDSFIALDILLLGLGGYALVGASNAYNQVIECRLDALMMRTQNRPIPAGRMSVRTALRWAIIMTFIGGLALWALNPKTALFGLLSVVLYAGVYTPLKTKTPLAVFVGAIPGAIPFMLGWVAATNSFGIEPGTLFMVQFFWPFPHFWALAWMLDEDYQRGGFALLPTRKKDTTSAALILIYIIWMLLVAIIPVFGVTGTLSLSVYAAVVITSLGLVMGYYGVQLFLDRSTASAKKLMLASVFYISAVQVIYVLDRWI